MKSVVLAFSGGIDSCAALDWLRGEGYHVVGVTIDMTGDNELIRSAQQRAQEHDLELRVVDAQGEFHQKIIDNFVGEYLAGRTPAPCTRCNPLIKWDILARVADELGIYHIATGHYFQIERVDELYYVSRAVDPQKDQSYYLWGVPQSLLARALTPMGRAIKSEVKRLSAIKSESMGVCFLNRRPYAEFITSQCGEMPSGDVVDRSGRVVGRHNGVARYTIGQRRGEGIPEAMRVVELRADLNQVCVGDNSELFHRVLYLDSCHFVDRASIELLTNIRVMIRGLGLNPEGCASVELSDDGAAATIILSSPAWAAAPGQPIVLYSENRVVGGGYLTRSQINPPSDLVADVV